jgi:hypothetical protein
MKLRPGPDGADPIYAWLPGTETYVQVTEQMLKDIHRAISLLNVPMALLRKK